MPVERSDDVWDRLSWLWGAFYGLMLAVAATLSAVSLEGSAARRLVPVAGAVALLVLERVADRLVGPDDRPGGHAVAAGFGWYAASLALLIPLVQTSGFFGLALYGFLPRVFALLPERTSTVAAVAVVPVLLIGEGGTSVLTDPDAWASAVGSGVLSVVISFIMASAFSSILVYAIDLVPHRVGLVGGLFYGLSFGLGGVAAAGLGLLADHIGIVDVFRFGAWLPALGLLAFLLPRNSQAN